MKRHEQGFSLLEVLIALAIIAIAFTALYASMLHSTQQTGKLKSKTIARWVMKSEISKVRMQLVSIPPTKAWSGSATLFGQHWYWKASLQPTQQPQVSQLHIVASQRETGPFNESLDAYLFTPGRA